MLNMAYNKNKRHKIGNCCPEFATQDNKYIFIEKEF